MRLLTVKTIVLSLAMVAAGCGGGGAVLVESTPRPNPVDAPSQISGPETKFQVPVPEVDWTPMTIGAAKSRQLTQALVDNESLAMILPQKHRIPELEERVFRMIKGASPNAKVVARGRMDLRPILIERGEIPYRRTMEMAGVDVIGRPYFVPKDHPLNTEWLQKKKPLKGAGAMFTVQSVSVSDNRLRELRDGRHGSCAEFNDALRKGLDNGDEYFGPYKDAADNALAEAFARHLSVALPFWRQEIERAASYAGPVSPTATCVKAYTQLLDSYDECLEGPCKQGPQLAMVEGGIIGIVDANVHVADSCPAEGMRDYLAEIKDLAVRAAADALPVLDSSWTGELIRQGALGQIEKGVQEFCTARHRRLTSEDLTKARGEVKLFLESLAGQELTGTWDTANGMTRMPGVGPLNILARVRVPQPNPVDKAKELSKRLRAYDRCDYGGEKLLQATLIDVGTSEVVFLGLFFEEELLCEDLPPGDL